MDITPSTPESILLIQRYGNGGFVINGVPYRGSILLVGGKVLHWTDDDAWEESTFPDILSAAPEIFLLGTGPEMKRLPPALREDFKAKHISADTMDTGAACRTYNILVAEDRFVAAALIAI